MRFSELDGATIGLWGAGRETRSLAAQLRPRLPSARIAVVVSDGLTGGDAVEELAPFDPSYVADGDVVAELAACDVVVRSPGVSIYRPELAALRERGVPVTTATALWLAERGGEGVIGVTGTKGKSTTAALIVHLARAAGRVAHLAGNIGAPALDLLDTPATDLAVVELSSYQIADLTIGPQIAVVTNLYPEHVDWHGSHDAYYADKLRLLTLPGVAATVLNAGDPQLASVRDAVAPAYYGAPGAGWYVRPAGIVLDRQVVLPRAELPLRGRHNALNLCAALTAIDVAGIARPPLPDALQGFSALPHRLQVLCERDGIAWVDDSISTTPESTLAALESFSDGGVVLLAGGQDRGQDYTELGGVLADRDAVVLGLPDTGSALVEAARRAGLDESRAVPVPDMETAVARARELATPGTAAVLLSPAAPSYNAYSSFEERGAHFGRLVLGSG